MENNNKKKNMEQMKNKNGGNGKKGKKDDKKSLIILLGVIVTYIVLYFIFPDKIKYAFNYSYELILSIIPVLVFVFVVMFGFNLIHEDKIKNMVMKSSKSMQYLIMAVLGTISHGPIYAWYPLMKNLREKGISDGAIASFLYSRSIKLSFLPMAIYYFGLKYMIVLTIFMFIFAYFQGIIIDKIMQEN